MEESRSTLKSRLQGTTERRSETQVFKIINSWELSITRMLAAGY